jgi:hypothetical protein
MVPGVDNAMGSHESNTKILLSLGNIPANDQPNHQSSKKKGHAKGPNEGGMEANQQSLSASPNLKINTNSHVTYQKKAATKYPSNDSTFGD